ncbi:FkbM family methyltransferase [Acetobacter suratthaniensis]|uniref:FkbM family methyltransferase n=1 Tax=Acetobacter suratthaniensis TaxID=1502841 RepID=A0ABS3LMY7_9PROT|nr:FkbM family methyltransferase [Acetobacter suratthaniensis]MCX2566826.1 FkbM family methyltransferase [Acetobacter suratthaniensis]
MSAVVQPVSVERPSVAERLLRGVLHWRFLPFALRRKLLGWLVPRGLKGERRVNLFGLDYCCAPSNLIDTFVYYTGMYEQSTLSCMQYCVKIIPGLSEQAFLDIGANSGLFSILGSRLFSSVLAFEPFPAVFSRLKSNVERNGFSNIRLFPFGLGDKAGALLFVPPEKDNMGTGYFITASKAGSGVPLPVRVGDTVLADIPVAIGLVKIDVEGFEPHVLRGLRRTLERDQPVIIMELNRDTKKSFVNEETFMNTLPRGYRVLAIRTKVEDFVPVAFDWAGKQENILAVPPHLAGIFF